MEVVEPFGVESLQLITSNRDRADKLPHYKYDPNTELYITSKDPDKGISKTRALKKKISKNAKSTEAVLLFTTSSR